MSFATAAFAAPSMLPQPITLPYVQTIHLGRVTPCLECPPEACPASNIPFSVAGAFPSPCFVFESIRFLEPVHLGFPLPPVLEIEVVEHACEVCPEVLSPWSAAAELPPLPPGSYELTVQLHLHRFLCDSLSSDTVYIMPLAFTVLDTCPGLPPIPGDSCVVASWQHSQTGPCDAFVTPAHPAVVTLGIGSGVPLAGLQGRLHVYPAGLVLSHLEPVGAAVGMHLAWTRTADGAQFLLFAEHGAPIPKSALFTGSPILNVTAVQAEDTVAPPVTTVSVTELLASDSTGRQVRGCDIRTAVFEAARICSVHGCDLNNDGVSDVRDLVLMVHCVLGFGDCPDTTLQSLDCDGNGQTSLDDVLCCARSILQGGVRDTVLGRPEPAVGLQIGVPLRTGAGVDVPLQLSGADRVGAARLLLEYPDQRFDVSSVELVGSPSGWLALDEVRNDGLAIGLIGLSAAVPRHEPIGLDMVVHLTLKAGQSADGDVRVADGDFSGPDGARLRVTLMQSPAPLVPRRLALSHGRPNPFGSETRFAVTLVNAGEIEVTVHDLAGRRIATVARGPFPAGTHEMVWKGELDDGSQAPDGLYFATVRSGSERRSQTLVLLRGR